MTARKPAWGTPRPVERIPELLAVLAAVWSHPARKEERLGQFLINAVRTGTVDMTPEEIERRLWAIEDAKLLDLLRAEHDRLSAP